MMGTCTHARVRVGDDCTCGDCSDQMNGLDSEEGHRSRQDMDR